MEILRIVSSLLESNVYVLKNKGECLIIDGGAKLNEVKNAVGGERVVGILLTHGHYDHSLYIDDYAREFDAKIYANFLSPLMLADGQANYSEGKFELENFENFIFVQNGEELNLGVFNVKCISASGHSKCSTVFLIDGNLFAGDVLFARGMGRTDLIGSNSKEMLDSLNYLETLDFKMCYSGHGGESTREQQTKNIVLCKRLLGK